jgi:hypothetical protein
MIAIKPPKMLITETIHASLPPAQVEVPFLPPGKIQMHSFSAEFVNLNKL